MTSLGPESLLETCPITFLLSLTVAGALLYESPGNGNEQPEDVTHRQNSEEFLYVHSLSFYKLIYDVAKIKEKKKSILFLWLYKSPQATSAVQQAQNTVQSHERPAQG